MEVEDNISHAVFTLMWSYFNVKLFSNILSFANICWNIDIFQHLNTKTLKYYIRIFWYLHITVYIPDILSYQGGLILNGKRTRGYKFQCSQEASRKILLLNLKLFKKWSATSLKHFIDINYEILQIFSNRCMDVQVWAVSWFV